MSSFVIGKEQYIKAAAITAAVAEAKKLWIYDYETRRNMTPEDYHRVFSECYDMNALSVQEQYHDIDLETDSNDYMTTFKAYMMRAKGAIMAPARLREIILTLNTFFKSAEYQTEKESYYFKMQMFFNRLNAAFLPLMAPPQDDVKGWGSIDL